MEIVILPEHQLPESQHQSCLWLSPQVLRSLKIVVGSGGAQSCKGFTRSEIHV